jgi:hypothetical protein
MSSPTGFFDILYLGVFIIFSAVFDSRFYSTTKPPPTLVEELAYAEHQFHSLLHIFSQRFIVVLEGEPVAHSYVVDRMLGEFAAAVVVFAKALCGPMDDRLSLVVERIEGIVQGSYPMVFPYYLQCLDRDHMHFIWTGPDLQILPRIESFDAIMPLLTVGELLDLPSHQIYHPIATTDMPSAIPIGPLSEKRHNPGDSLDLEVEQPMKRRR